MIAEVKKQTRQQYRDNQWMFVQPLWSFNRLRVVQVDYQPSTERLEVMKMDYRDGYELFIPQPGQDLPF